MRSGPVSSVGFLAFLVSTVSLPAVDFFPDPIPKGPVALRLEEFARIPDSSPGQPPELNLMTGDPRGRLFVNDHNGPLYQVGPLGEVVVEYFDLRDYPELELLNTKTERGFQSFAFHPGFFDPSSPGHGLLYTMHSSLDVSETPDFDPGGSDVFHSVLLEWRTGRPEAVPFDPAEPETPYREVLRLKQPGNWHNVGLIAFHPSARPGDPDYGGLYVGVGDGVTSGDPQGNGRNPANPYGALLRIDPLGTNAANGRYGIVEANLLASDGDSGTLGEIFAFGLRNPQRFSWDREAGRMFLSDIGENRVEELNRIVNGGNYGWNVKEGSFPFRSGDEVGLIDPVAEYDHTDPVADMPTDIRRRAVTVGPVIRGFAHAGANGLLLFGDIVTGLVFTIDVDSDPLDGGQDGIRELDLIDAEGESVRLLEAINSERPRLGLSSVQRADVRFGLETGSRLFVLNKHDGLVRRLVPVRPLRLEYEGGRLRVDFYGPLETSSDLERFTPLDPQPESPWIFGFGEGARFFRTTRP